MRIGEVDWLALGLLYMSTVEERGSRSMVEVVGSESFLRPLEGFEILFVEDQPDNQMLVNHYLSGTGANLTIASDGIEGLEKAALQRYDIIILDLHMPRMDGYTAAEVLRHRGIMVPIIALTANSLEESRLRARERGFNEYLLKPVDAPLLISTLQKYYFPKPIPKKSKVPWPFKRHP